MSSFRNSEMLPQIGDQASRELADHIVHSAQELPIWKYQHIEGFQENSIFISHTSKDDRFITGSNNGFPEQGSILRIAAEYFFDPFYHSITTGAAESYAEIVGVALLTSLRFLVVWSENALYSDYVRAEILIANEYSEKKLAAYIMPNAPKFPMAQFELVSDLKSLELLLKSWKKA